MSKKKNAKNAKIQNVLNFSLHFLNCEVFEKLDAIKLKNKEKTKLKQYC